MEGEPCVFLGIKVKPGPIERHKLENYTLDHTVDSLKNEAEKKTNLPSSSLELIHHGKILKNEATLQDSGVKSGEMIHVVKKKEQPPPSAPTPFSDAELQQLNVNLRTLGCTPNAPGWTRAMQLLNDESAMSEILEHAPSLNEDCVTLSILHEVELLAALGANLQTMRRAADAHPELPHALRQLTRLVRSRSSSNASNDNVPTSGFAYSLEALSDDEEVEEEESEDAERNPITQEQLAAALQAASEAVSSSSGAASSGARRDSLLRLLQQARDPAHPHHNSIRDVVGRSDSLLRLLQQAREESRDSNDRDVENTAHSDHIPIDHSDSFLRLLQQARAEIREANEIENANAYSGEHYYGGSSSGAGSRAVITPEMFSEAISEAISRAARPPATPAAATPMDHSTAGSATESPAPERATAGGGGGGAGGGEFSTQLAHMHEMGLLDDAVNVRALLIAAEPKESNRPHYQNRHWWCKLYRDVNAAINLVFSGAITDD